MAFLPLTGAIMNLNKINAMTNSLSNTAKMPLLFLGHGSPMNGISENEFVQGFRDVAKSIPVPNAILCVSAHWETRGTQVTAMPNPPTIHDFGGFPKELYEVEYPAPGNPELAKETQKLISSTDVALDEKWGLDHGAWSVIRHMYPEAEIPVIQMSIDYLKSPEQHYELAAEISALREKGVLIIGSGNIVHNLRRVAWDKLDANYGFDWAIEANEMIKKRVLEGNHTDLLKYNSLGSAISLAVPTPEHYLPLLYVLALKEKNEEVNLFNDETVGGSLSMTSVRIG